MAQRVIKVSGVVLDEEKQPMVAATVVLLHLSDSSFASYVLTNDFGQFQLDGKKDSTYLLQISYLGYNAYRQNILLLQDTLLAPIKLEIATNTLESIEVSAEHIPMQMRGDTLSFNSAAFHVRTHDNVESLLKQLPGVEVDENGNVTVNGKKVTEILVDGKEFFGANAQIVLKNLPADVIKNIDVTDTKKNKEGEEVVDQKTINLNLKENSKKGLMGYLSSGYGYTIPPRTGTNFSTELGNHRYLGSVMLNYFSPKFQLSISGATNNVNEPLYIAQAGQDPTEVSYSQSGITRALMGGISAYAVLSKSSKLSLNYNYFNNTTSTNQLSSLRSILENNIYSREGQTISALMPNRHIFSTSLQQKIDSTQKLNIYCTVNYEHNSFRRNKNTTTKGENDQIENEIIQLYQNAGTRFRILPRLNYQKSFKKKKRRLSANFKGTFGFNPKGIDNRTLTDLYNNSGTLIEIDTLEQEQEQVNNIQNTHLDVEYTEPIGNYNRLSFKLILGIKNGQNIQSTYDVNLLNRIKNDSLSNSYWQHNDYQEANIHFNRQTKKYIFNIGAGIKRSALEGVAASNTTKINQAFYFPTGFLRMRYYITRSNKLNFSYRSRFLEPRIDQLQPIVNNQNPLYIIKGNPNLMPEYHHDFGLGTNLWNKTTFTNIYASINFSVIQNSIIRSQTFDNAFRSIEEPINSEIGYRGGVRFAYNQTVKKIGIKIIVRGGGNFYRQPIVLNGILTNQFNQNYNLNFSVTNKNKDIIDFMVAAEISIGNAVYENTSNIGATYINHNYGADLRVTIAKKWNIETAFRYYIYGNTSYGDAILVPIWSVGIYRTFLKDDVLKISLVGENLLNEALRVNRSNQDGIISEQQSVLLGRYAMLKIAYRIKNVKL